MGPEALVEHPKGHDPIMTFADRLDIGGWGLRRSTRFENDCEEVEIKNRAEKHSLPLRSNAFGKVGHAVRRMGSQCVDGEANSGFLDKV